MRKNDKAKFKIILKGELNKDKTFFKSCSIEADIDDDETLPIKSQHLYIQAALYLQKVINENDD